MRDFIITCIKALSENNPDIKISYVYDERYSQHIFEVLPKDIYYSEKFAEQQIKFEISLIKKDPAIDIMFITEGHDVSNIPAFDFTIGSSI